MKIQFLVLLALAVIAGSVFGQNEPAPFVFVQRIEHKLSMELKSSDSSPYQVTFVTADGRKMSAFVEVGRSFHPRGSNEFEVMKFEKKTNASGDKDLSELTVRETGKKQDIVLVYRVPQNAGPDEAELRMKSGGDETFKVRKGEAFAPPHQQGPMYQLVDVQADRAIIAPLKADGTRGGEIVVGK